MKKRLRIFIGSSFPTQPCNSDDRHLHPGPQTQVLFAMFLSVIVNFIFGEEVSTDALPVFTH